ncbi:hypothetical protein Tco_1373218 [Tanacetum coccineum]
MLVSFRIHNFTPELRITPIKEISTNRGSEGDEESIREDFDGSDVEKERDNNVSMVPDSVKEDVNVQDEEKEEDNSESEDKQSVGFIKEDFDGSDVEKEGENRFILVQGTAIR